MDDQGASGAGVVPPWWGTMAPMSGETDLFTSPTPPQAGGGPVRAYRQWTLPTKLLSGAWSHSEFGESDLTFRMVELRGSEKESAGKRAGSQASPVLLTQDQLLGQELILASMVQVGDWKTARERDKLMRWWDAIGAKCQRLVENAWVAMNSVDEAEIEGFLDSGVNGLG